MEKLYSSPFRIYIFFALLLGIGAYSYFKIPVALFPNSTKPKIWAEAPYGRLTRDNFLKDYGKDIEAQFKKIQTKDCTTEEVQGDYHATRARYKIRFKWGDDGDACLKEVTQIFSNFKSRWPENVQRETWTHLDASGSGFFFGFFHSSERSSDEVYNLVEPVLQPKLDAIAEANKPVIYNPQQKQITVELLPVKMASFKLLPKDILEKIRNRLTPFSGGTFNKGADKITIEVSSDITVIDDLKKILVSGDSTKKIYLEEVADVRFETSSEGREIFKVNGSSAIVVFITPAPGKNIRIMSQKIQKSIEETLRNENLPKDIQFETAIDPGDFIEQSVNNVMGEVWLCSLLAVLVLFIFIGSFVGTLTALIEIPTSIILSFILMRLTGVQLNMVSLGGLALSVGMNVDASIVVIDSIIKKFAEHGGGNLSPSAVVKAVADAVREVAVPVIVSTITSLIVFIPLVFTSDLSYAILGDLAKAVIYSHGISLFVAMILVPVVRIHMAQYFGSFAEHHSIKWLDNALEWSYDAYCRALKVFLNKNTVKYGSYLAIFLALVLASVFIPPRLKREIIGKPDTAIIFTEVESKSNVHINQMEEQISKFERRINEKFGKDIRFTQTSIGSPNNAWVAFHLENKGEFSRIKGEMQEMTKGDTDADYQYESWNPAELPIPNPPDWKVNFVSSTREESQKVMDDFRIALLNAGIVDDLSEDTNRIFNNKALLQLHEERLDFTKTEVGSVPQPSDLAEIIRLATAPMRAGEMTIKNRTQSVMVKYPDQLVKSMDEFAAFPVPFGDKVVPLRALVDFKMSKEPPELRRLDGQDNFTLDGHLSEKEKKNERDILARFKAFVDDFKEKELPLISKFVSIETVDAKVELSKALNELTLAISIAIGLIFLVLLIQFGSIVHSLIVLLAIPFGILGVLVSLYVFDSTLSLNSGLGIILLVGITVANSIMLVEMIVRLVEMGTPIEQAILETAKKRIRPIVMTSLTTILGMLPIAIGHGEGGKVLQPLGIAVCGGLWVSLVFTLFVIPALELSYLRSLLRK